MVKSLFSHLLRQIICEQRNLKSLASNLVRLRSRTLEVYLVRGKFLKSDVQNIQTTLAQFNRVVS